MKIFGVNFTVCFHGSNWQQTSVGSDDGLEPNRQQAIIWTNDGIVHWQIYASLSVISPNLKTRLLSDTFMQQYEYIRMR